MTITPDITIAQPELSQFAIDLERKNYFFQFAVKYAARHPNTKEFKVTPEAMAEFKQILADDKFTYEQAAWDANADYIDRGLRREVARRLHGSKAAYMVSIEGDGTYVFNGDGQLTKIDGQNGEFIEIVGGNCDDCAWGMAYWGGRIFGLAIDGSVTLVDSENGTTESVTLTGDPIVDGFRGGCVTPFAPVDIPN